MIARFRFHQGGDLPSVVSKHGDGSQKERKMMHVYIFHRYEQVLSQAQFSSRMN
jgi:hypothetical protein